MYRLMHQKTNTAVLHIFALTPPPPPPNKGSNSTILYISNTLPIPDPSPPNLPVPKSAIRNKFNVVIQSIPSKLIQTHKLWSLSTSSSWKQKLATLATTYLQSLPWREQMIKKWIAPSQVIVYHDRAFVLQPNAFQTFLNTNLLFHMNWRLVTCGCLPLSILFGLVPGPNIPLLYNAFRVYSHDMAVTNLKYIMDTPITYKEVPIPNEVIGLYSVPDSELSSNLRSGWIQYINTHQKHPNLQPFMSFIQSEGNLDDFVKNMFIAVKQERNRAKKN